MTTQLSRRDLVKTTSMAALGVGLAGCAPTSAPSRRFAKVDVSPDRVIRTTVGLRPFRTEGFLVGSQRFGEKTVVHNYGHASNGVSMSWGTGWHSPRDCSSTPPAWAPGSSSGTKRSSRSEAS